MNEAAMGETDLEKLEAMLRRAQRDFVVDSARPGAAVMTVSTASGNVLAIFGPDGSLSHFEIGPR